MTSLEEAKHQAYEELREEQNNFFKLVNKLRETKSVNPTEYKSLLERIFNYSDYSIMYKFDTTDDDGNDCESSVDVWGYNFREGFNGSTHIPTYHISNPFIEKLDSLLRELNEKDLLLKLKE